MTRGQLLPTQAISKFKAFVQSSLGRVGYRLVPQARDAYSLWSFIYSMPVATVIDVGASRGDTVKSFRKMFPTATIHAVEADPETYQVLTSNVSSLAPAVRTWNFAAGEANGTTTFFRHLDHGSSSSILRTTAFTRERIGVGTAQEEILVPVRTLDDVFANAALPRKILLKLDVQGAERLVLAGATQLLCSTDALLCELNLQAIYTGQASLIDLVECARAGGLSFAGFVEQFHLRDGTPIYADVMFVR